MERLSVLLYQRDFQLSAPWPHPLRVERLSWCADGGPQSALLCASLPAGSAELQLLAGNLLRCPVQVFDESGSACWWGYVSAVEVCQGQLASRVCLDQLVNRAAVSYRQRTPEQLWVGERLETAWAEEPASLQMYGCKERLLEIPAATDAQAAAARDALLARFAQPAPGLRRLPQPVHGIELRLECRGWWDTLAWTYFRQELGSEGFVLPGAGTQNLGRSAASDAQIAQSFQTSQGPWELAEVFINAGVYGNPSDQLVLEVCADHNGVPGAVLQSASLNGADIPNGRWWLRFSLPAVVAVAANSRCWLKLRRSGALNTSHYYRIYVDDNNQYPRGQLLTWTGSAWIARQGGLSDLNFYLCGVIPTHDRVIEAAGSTSGGGQFLSGVRVRAAVTARTLLWKQGLRSCQAEIMELLQTGDANGRRMIGLVLPDRMLEVSSLPEPADLRYRAGIDGSLRTLAGEPVPLSRRVVGRWARVEAGWLNQPVLLWRASWSAQRGLAVEWGEEVGSV